MAEHSLVGEVLVPFSTEVLDISSSSSEEVEDSHLRDESLGLTLGVSCS